MNIGNILKTEQPCWWLNKQKRYGEW